MRSHWFNAKCLHVRRIMPKPGWAKQSVKILGLGAEDFDDAVTGVSSMHRKMSGQYKLGSFEAWDVTREGEWPALDFSSRYVTPAAVAKGYPAVPFDVCVDPHGILLNSTMPFGKHLEDNRVMYYEASKDR